jgi:transcriptional regulator with PAS, ATPase and Fis domain
MSNDLLVGKRCVVAPETLELLKQHNWPGNVRELRNVIERAVNLSQGEEITPNYLPDYLLEKVDFYKADIEEYDSLRYAVIKAEREAIVRVLKKFGNNKSAAAKALGIHRTSLYKKMELYHLAFETEDALLDE